MLMTGAQIRSLAEFSDGTDCILLSALFDPNIDPQMLIMFRKEDGKVIVIHRDGSMHDYSGEIERALAGPTDVKALVVEWEEEAEGMAEAAQIATGEEPETVRPANWGGDPDQ